MNFKIPFSRQLLAGSFFPLLLFTAVRAEPTSVPVTIDGLVAQALTGNPELKFYKAEIAVARAGRKIAGKLSNPELDLEGDSFGEFRMVDGERITKKALGELMRKRMLDQVPRQNLLVSHGHRHRRRCGSSAPDCDCRQRRYHHFHFPHPARRASALRMAGAKNQTKKPSTYRIMKTVSKLIAVALLVAFTGSALADVTIKEGPRKGRLLGVDGQSAEFLVEKDRTVSIAIYDAAMNAQPAAVKLISATAEAPTGKVKLEFEK